MAPKPRSRRQLKRQLVHVEDLAAVLLPEAVGQGIQPILGPSPAGNGFVITALTPSLPESGLPLAELAPDFTELEVLHHLKGHHWRSHLAICPMGRFLIELEPSEKGRSTLVVWEMWVKPEDKSTQIQGPRRKKLDANTFHMGLATPTGDIIALAEATRLVFIDGYSLESIGHARPTALPDEACAIAVDPREHVLVVPEVDGVTLIPLRDRTVDQPLPLDAFSETFGHIGDKNAQALMTNPESSRDLPPPIAFPGDRDDYGSVSLDPEEVAEEVVTLVNQLMAERFSRADMDAALEDLGLTWRDLTNEQKLRDAGVLDEDADISDAVRQLTRATQAVMTGELSADHIPPKPAHSQGITPDGKYLYMALRDALRVYDWHRVEARDGRLPEPKYEVWSASPAAAIVGSVLHDADRRLLVFADEESGVRLLALDHGANTILLRPPERGSRLIAMTASLDWRHLCCTWTMDEGKRTCLEVWDYQGLLEDRQ